jgi:hypothetical protein
VNILNKQARKTGKGRPSGFGLCEVLTTPYCKNVKYYESLKNDLGLRLILLQDIRNEIPSLYSIKENMEVLFVASSLEVNAEQTKHVAMPR